MPRPIGDKDGNAGPFPAPACPVHRGHFGGGKPPPPTVPPMRHAGPPAYTERKAPCNRTVRQGMGAKEAAASGGGARESTERDFEAYREPLVNVTAFKYLGWVLTAGDDDWPAVVGNLSKAKKIWGWLSRILSQKGADPKVSGNFFKRCRRR